MDPFCDSVNSTATPSKKNKPILPISLFDFFQNTLLTDAAFRFRTFILFLWIILLNFLNREIPEDTGKPCLTTLIEHVIDIGGHEPFEQRHYFFSPKGMEAIFTKVDAMNADEEEIGSVQTSVKSISVTHILYHK